MKTCGLCGEPIKDGDEVQYCGTTCHGGCAYDHQRDEQESNRMSDEQRERGRFPEGDDNDPNNPVDCSAEVWSEIYSDPDYDLDHDHGMDY